MKRREFIKSSGALATMSLLPFSCISESSSPKYKMGYQLYSIRDEMVKDPIATLKALKKMGYQDFETYGYDAENDTYYGFKSKEFKTILDELDLSVSSGHYGFSKYFLKPEAELKHYVEQCIEGATTLQSEYITCPLIDDEFRNRDGFMLAATKFNLVAEQIAKAGLGFAYHNHGYDFIKHGKSSGYDIIMTETDPDLVKLQLDLYWAMHSSTETPSEIIDKHPGRFVMWHIKDMDKVTRDYTELGNGSIDYHNILPDPVKSGLKYYYIEQGGNYKQNSMKSAADSADYFKRHLQQYL